jgi:hypothetical protein
VRHHGRRAWPCDLLAGAAVLAVSVHAESTRSRLGSRVRRESRHAVGNDRQNRHTERIGGLDRGPVRRGCCRSRARGRRAAGSSRQGARSGRRSGGTPPAASSSSRGSSCRRALTQLLLQRVRGGTEREFRAVH